MHARHTQKRPHCSMPCAACRTTPDYPSAGRSRDCQCSRDRHCSRDCSRDCSRSSCDNNTSCTATTCSCSIDWSNKLQTCMASNILHRNSCASCCRPSSHRSLPSPHAFRNLNPHSQPIVDVSCPELCTEQKTTRPHGSKVFC